MQPREQPSTVDPRDRAGSTHSRGPYLPSSAVEVRRVNANLDATLLDLVRAIPERHLHDVLPEGHWTLAEHLGHLAEFPRTFARQLGEWVAGQRAVVGRRDASDTDFHDAVVRAAERRLADLVDELEASLAQLAGVLTTLTDDHLASTVEVMGEGRTPAIRFLGRSVLDHKRDRAAELSRQLADL